MSHAAGLVKFKDDTIFHYEYNGTSDVILPWLYTTEDEMRKQWRKPREWKTCSCGGMEEVEIYSEYGNGFMIKGQACKNCMIVSATLDILDDYDYNMKTTSLLSDWVLKYYESNK